MRLTRVAFERLFLGLIALLAAILLPEALRVGLWRSGMPGPGLYPLLLLGIILGISAFLCVQGGRVGNRAGVLRIERAGDIVAVLAALVLVTLLMPYLGFRMVIIFFVGFLMVWLGGWPNWSRAALIAAASLALSFGLDRFFANVFRVFLPVGQLTGM